MTTSNGADVSPAADLDFTCSGVEADPHSAGPTVVLRMRATESTGARVHMVALRCQVRIEPLRRQYSESEAGKVVDLFGERGRWGQTLQSLQLAFVTQMLPSFTGATTFDLSLPCSYDVDVAANKYLVGLEDGEAPLLLLFSGTVVTGTVGAIQVLPVPWHKETAVRMPVAVWRAAMDAHFPGQRWLRLHHETYDRLAAYRARHGMVGWDDAVERLLSEDPP